MSVGGRDFPKGVTTPVQVRCHGVGIGGRGDGGYLVHKQGGLPASANVI